MAAAQRRLALACLWRWCAASMGHAFSAPRSQLASVVEPPETHLSNQPRTTGCVGRRRVAGQPWDYPLSGENAVLQNAQTSVNGKGPDELLTVVNAAAALGISPWTLRHWISDRKIDVVK